MPRGTSTVSVGAEGGTESLHSEVGVWKDAFHPAGFYQIVIWFESRTIRFSEDVVKPSIRAFYRCLG